MNDVPLLDRAAIEDAFQRLGNRLARRGVIADLYIFGGAAMALAYDARRSTRDIDAVFEPTGSFSTRHARSRLSSACHRGGSTSRPVHTSLLVETARLDESSTIQDYACPQRHRNIFSR